MSDGGSSSTTTVTSVSTAESVVPNGDTACGVGVSPEKVLAAVTPSRKICLWTAAWGLLWRLCKAFLTQPVLPEALVEGVLACLNAAQTKRHSSLATLNQGEEGLEGPKCTFSSRYFRKHRDNTEICQCLIFFRAGL